MYDNNDLMTGFALGKDSNGNCNGNGGFGFGDGWSGLWGIIILAMIFGWGNGGWGGFGGFGGNGALQGALTRSDLCAEFNANDLQNAVRGVQQGICDSTFALNNTVVNGFSNVSRDMCTGFANVAAGLTENRFAAQQSACSIERAIDNSRFDTQTGFNALGSQLASCCCDIRSGLKDIQFQNATDTCAIQTSLANVGRDIIDNQNANYRGLMDFMVQSKIDSLQNENQALRLSASQAAQNSVLMAAMDANKAEILRKTGAECPMPAYVVQPPQPVTFPTNCCGGVNYAGYGNNGCGCNSGCGC